MNAIIKSLRGRLLVLIVAPLSLLVAMGVIALYFDSQQKAQQIHDNLLRTISQVILRDVVLSEGDLLTEQLLETLTESLNDQIFYQVRGEIGSSLFVGYLTPPEIPDEVIIKPYEPFYYDAIYYEQPVRVVVAREFVSALDNPGWVTIYVWQTTIGQRSLLLELAESAFATMLIMLLSTAIIVWFGVKFGLKPLSDLQNAIKKRSANDLTRIKRKVPVEVVSLVSAMNHLFDQLKKAFTEKDDFIANAAHQLRNPIAGIQSQAEAAEHSKTMEGMRQRVGDVAEAARRTSRLTQQLLSMAHVSQRSIQAEFRRFDLLIMMQEVLTRSAKLAHQQGVALSLHCDESAIELTGSAAFLSEAIDNLLDNALCYGCPKGGVIDVSVKLEGANVCILIQDDGDGIAPELVPKMYERFTHGPNPSGGSGLGLSIAKTIVELHNGELEIVSDNQGTCAQIQLPLYTNTSSGGELIT